MTTQKPHILLNGFVSSDDFQSRNRGRSPIIPPQERTRHGSRISQQYSRVLSEYQRRREQSPSPITDDVGIYVEITGVPNCKLPLDSLDTSQDFKLRSCRKTGDNEVAIIFIPEAKRQAFHRKVEQYLDADKDGKNGPRNQSLIDSILEIKIADLHSFWTDHESLYPADSSQIIWWELWLKNIELEDPFDIAQQLADRINAELGNSYQSFFDSAVVLIKASVNQLGEAPELIANLQELRRAKETSNVWFTFRPREQFLWSADLQNRLQIQDSATAVTILDTGVNFDHPLLSQVCSEEESERWSLNWPFYDMFSPSVAQPFNDHGSRQAGLAAFGNLHDALTSEEPVALTHRIESGRILPPAGNNPPELYGAITIRTAMKLDQAAPDISRVYSLAITAQPERVGGQPSSWSAEIDQFAFGSIDEKQRLFVISVGNNPEVSPSTDYWDQVHLAEIEDPAQSWNALSVGAYTEMTTNDNPAYNGWTPFSVSGDIAPYSRSAVNWAWRDHSPYKPDVVAEGGNRLVSPDRTEVSDEDTVALLSTSGKTSGQLFETAADTSAACALVSRQAAILMAEYPSYWPETVRALLVHSAEWTSRMWERFGLLHQVHSVQLAKKTMLRTVGYGVPSLKRARYSANHILTLVAQNSLQPFFKQEDATPSTDPKLHKMQLYQLPWPVEVLQQLQHDLEVKLRVTLSYFIEPSPGRKGYRQRYSYASHGLRFEVIRPGQSLENFQAFVNHLSNQALEGYSGPEGEKDGWFFGKNMRTRGSIHSDTWTGSAAALADMHTIAVYPVGGWWKYRTAKDKWKNHVRYSLVISIDVPDEETNIYSPVETQVANIVVDTEV